MTGKGQEGWLGHEYLEMSLPPHEKLGDPAAWQLGPIHVYILPSKSHHALQGRDELRRTELYSMDLFIFVL